jgi:hypothetical protein
MLAFQPRDLLPEGKEIQRDITPTAKENLSAARKAQIESNETRSLLYAPSL